MSWLNKIIPFYSVIEDFLKTGTKVVSDWSERKTIRTQAEMDVWVKTEYRRRLSGIEEKEKDLSHKRDLEKLHNEALVLEESRKNEHSRTVDLQRLCETQLQSAHKRQMEFERHRLELFENLKRLEVDIHQNIMTFASDHQKKLLDWHREFERRLQDEKLAVLEDRLPRLMLQAEKLRSDPQIFRSYVDRIFVFVDQTVEEINGEILYFRDALRWMHDSPRKLTESVMEINRQLQLPYIARKPISELEPPLPKATQAPQIEGD